MAQTEESGSKFQFNAQTEGSVQNSPQRSMQSNAK